MMTALSVPQPSNRKRELTAMEPGTAYGVQTGPRPDHLRAQRSIDMARSAAAVIPGPEFFLHVLLKIRLSTESGIADLTPN